MTADLVGAREGTTISIVRGALIDIEAASRTAPLIARLTSPTFVTSGGVDALG